MLGGAQYLELHRKTGIGLRTLWILVQHWEEYGGEPHACVQVPGHAP